MRAILIPPDFRGSVKEVDIPADTMECLRAIQKHVKGDIEAVVWDRPDVVGYINDEGKYRGGGYNSRASVLFINVLHPGDHIAGPMVLTGQNDDGETVDLNKYVTVDVLMGVFRSRTRT